MNYIIIATALLPVIILIVHILLKDKKSPEPVGQLIKAFAFGILSIPISLCISLPLLALFDINTSSIIGSILNSFLGAAIPEEIAKLFMLWLLLRKNKYFDEKVDGIVYAVCVSLGFASVENILYLFNNYDSFISVGIIRALFSVPGHFSFGILMGYFYSLAKFYPNGPIKYKYFTLLTPILAHGIFNSILNIISISSTLTVILTLVFIYFCFKLWSLGRSKIEEHLRRDSNII